MRSFSYARARSIDDVQACAADDDVALLAGGTELVNWIRIGIERPQRVLDIGGLPGLREIRRLEGGGLRIGALAKLNEVAQHPDVVSGYPVLSQAILKSASAQLRNLATIGGNPLQRTRCPYFRSEDPATPCNKRIPGSGCSALHGLNDRHAIFGWTEDCVAVHPSDPAVALACLDAFIVTEYAGGGRRLPVRTFHPLPGEEPTGHSVLRPGELIVAIELGDAAPQSAYLKVRERESYEFALVSAAAAVEIEDGRISRARVALGGVAARAWRLVRAEQELIGLSVGSAEATEVITGAFAEARPLAMNGYKIPLARNTALRALALAARQS
ncbi:FAD-binding molybdopterin dehydrogenase [Streptomyces hygroscopicus]|uniref:FAD binding domain-containing protein n=1 Tax=Streptomyces hygroscopicus TaxID=1912 RepID=UPI00224081CB|nr:xanthine dehydrogenase family protein subunit M [Streptomyces hygroscopicus]MCW7945717.1 FAD-binding molybdopterin dehydrogenase [Streptomyces hygroscopicus]